MERKQVSKIFKVALSVSALASLTACKLKSKDNVQSAATPEIISPSASTDSVVKPAEEGEMDLNSLYTWDDVALKFEKAKEEAGDLYYESQDYSPEQITNLLSEMKTLLEEFKEGGTIYQVKDACTLYKDAYVIANITSDETGVYRQIGEFAQASILTIYGGYTEEFDAITGIEDTISLIESIEN